MYSSCRATCAAPARPDLALTRPVLTGCSHHDSPDDDHDLSAFVATYVPADLEILEAAATFLEGPGDTTPLTVADRAYLMALELQPDMYPEMRMGEE